MIKNRDTENSLGLMAENIKGIGTMVNNMAKAHI